MIPHISTVDGITVVIKGRPVHVATDDKYYEDVVDAVQGGYSEDYIGDLIETTKREVEKACNLSKTMTYADGQVFYGAEPLHGYAIEKLVSLIHDERDTGILTRFLEKLQLNPSMQTREDLYQFLEYGKMPLTTSGNFLAYKAVRSDYKDIFTGTIENNIGSIVFMTRSQVDDRREVTCSKGLHVCSYEYLPHFSHSNGGHVMVVEVNPADVVSIPTDYNNTKMRVCAYKVIGEVEGWYAEHEDVLSDFDVYNEESFEVLGRMRNEEWRVLGEYDDDVEAEDEADAAYQGYDEVKVVNSDGVTIYHNGVLA